MAKETTVWLKPLDLPWEQVGTGQFQGITPENINLEADTWGPSNATFDLRREPDAPALDLSAGAEVEVHVAGVNVWDGFVSSTPKKRGDLVTSVVCRGWQDELDGRIFTAGYVHTSLTDWKDVRGALGTDLSSGGGGFPTAGGVSADGTGLKVSWPAYQPAGAFSKAGLFIDLGPGVTATTVAFDWATSNNTANYSFQVFGCDDIAGASYGTFAYEEPYSAVVNAGASGTNTTTFATPHRYVGVKVQATSAHTPTVDVWVRMSGVRVFTDAAYVASHQSILKASTVVSDALDRGTLALSSDRSGIDTTSFSIPDLWPDPKGVTARELISKVNAYHNWTAKLEPGRRFVFRARTTVPKVKVGEWSALPDDEDASSNDITDIYNHCRACSTEPGGSLVVVDRYAAQQASAIFEDFTSTYAANPSFATNTAGWTAGTSTITRDTGTYDTSPASGRWDNTGGSDSLDLADTLSYALTGTFRAGLTYRVSLVVRGSASSGFYDITLSDAPLQTGLFSAVSWRTGSIDFTPRADVVNPTLKLTITYLLAPTYVRVDSLSVKVGKPTILDKRGRVRSQILDATAALPADGIALTQLADTWLAAHMATPFKGKQAIQGSHSVRDYLTGDNVAPERLLGMTTDLLHFDDRTNPDTSDVGRDGRLVKVSYQPLTDTVQTDVDSTRSDFGALLVRIGVLTAS